jgi:hypothetical protein
MLDVDRMLALPIRALDKMTKRLLFELADGTRFHLVGGMDRRPLATGVAAFTPREMIQVLTSGLTEEDFKAIAKIKKVFGGGIESITNDSP